jgi:arabinose-5-phosphate isomerase
MSKTPDSAEIIAWGRTVLEEECQALRASSAALGEAFAKATAHILGCKGKVVTTGLGKSGHIAKKMAATLASTGTSAFYLHPTEALHGDFGMISVQDTVLAIAFGGETREVVEVAKFARRLGTSVIAITGKLDSTLARLADYVLDGGVEKEACPLNLAPTSSSMVAMGLGDALAVALMKAKGFHERDFAKLHPEGSLGKRLTEVTELMRMEPDLFTLKEGGDFHAVLAHVTRYNFGVAAVVDDAGNLVGAVSDGDLRRMLIKHEEKTFALKARDLMTKSPKTVSSDRFVEDAIRLMEEAKITSLFVVDKKSGKPAGIIRLHDLLTAKFF